MLIFDIHTHVFPEKIAFRALTVLQEKSHGLPFFTNGSHSGLLSKAEESSYTGMLNVPVATSPEQMESVNDWVASWSKFPLLSFGSIHPAAPNAVAELHRIKSLQLQGIKLHPEYQSFHILEKRLEKVWETCQELDIIVLCHAGNDIAYPEPAQSQPADFAELSRRYPALQIICAHMGGWRMWDKVEKDLVGSNVYLDTSFALPYMTEQKQFERIIKAHGSEKILFGTDSPWQDLHSGVNEILLADLTEQERENIFWNNAAKLLNLNQYIDND